MPDSMSRMINLIATLSDMQQKRRQLDLMEQQMAQQREQFYRTQGFAEDTSRTGKLDKMFERYTAGTSESRGSLRDIGAALGIEAGALDALENYGMNAPMTLEALRTQAANRGATQSTAGSDLESYLGATTGMNRGQVGMSGLTSDVAGLSGQLMSRDPGVATQAAQGMMPGWQQFQNVDIGRGGVEANMASVNAQLIIAAQRQAAELSSAKAMGMLTSEQKTQAINTLRQIRESIFNAKGDQANRMQALAEYNRLADLVDPSLRITPDGAPDKAGMMGRMGAGVNPPGLPGTPAPYNYQSGPVGQRPMMPFPPFNPIP